jgi:glucan 1,3-beta-glucosidase
LVLRLQLSRPTHRPTDATLGDGVADDTAAINAAISSFSASNQAVKRCGPGTCQSTTVSPAVVYFPAGTYQISSSLIDYYFTQIIGNPNDMPVLQATSNFTGLGLIDGDLYQSSGAQGWISTNIFYRQIKNIVLDMTLIPIETAATGIHWPTSQATSLQNVLIKMEKSSFSQQQGIFIENG